MTDICENIDSTITDNLPCPGIKFFGLCELVIKDKQVYPVTVNDRKQVSINDKYEGIFYHRLISSGSTQPENMQWGDKAFNAYKSKLRSVLVFKVNKFKEEFIFDFANALPDILTIQGYKMIDVTNNVSIIADQENIYKQEFGGGDYEKHILTWNIYAMEYEVEFIKC